MYPVWEVPYLSPGIILAIIAVFHILPSHLSVSAMWFNVYFESRAIREDRPDLIEFVKKFTLMLLVFAYVLGSLSGVGIWFATTLTAPRGISVLIHNYVWAWATEWVFFIIEVTCIFVYYYTLEKIDRKTHLKLGLIFALASWPTMMIIVGILSFMLTPGKWLETGTFLDGFYNPSYFTQLFVRTALMFVIGAVYSILVSTRIKNEDVRTLVVKTAVKWGTIGLIAGVILLHIFLKQLSADRIELLNTIVSDGLKKSMLISGIVILIYFVYSYLQPMRINLAQAVISILVVFAGIWSGERIREILRKPYVISNFMYSNQIITRDIPAKEIKSEIEKIKNSGILKKYPYVPEKLKEINENNLIEAGRLIALINCSACHVLNDRGLRPLPQMVERLGFEDPDVVESFIDALGSYPFMPQFAGSEMEKKALAHFLVSLNKKEGK